jgi:hypothetical protein
LKVFQVHAISQIKEEQDRIFFFPDYDCPLLPDMYGLIQWVSGGSLAAAEALVKRQTDI